MIKKTIHNKNNTFSTKSSKLQPTVLWVRWVRTIIIVFCLALGVFSSCSSPGSIEETTISITETSPTQTKEPIQPETALENSLQRFDSVQSFTVNTTWYDPQNTSSSILSSSLTYLNQADQIQLRETDKSFGDNAHETKLCAQDTCYTRDVTGLLKPTSDQYSPFRPYLYAIDLEFDDILINPYIFLGEEILEGMTVFKYEIQITDEQIESAAVISEWSEARLIDPRPQVFLYVNAENGFLARKQELYTEEYSYSSSETSYISKVEIIEDYYGWDSTTFSLPDQVIDESNTEWQEYSGKFSKLLSFQFPIVYSLDEDNGYPELETPSGATMTLKVMNATIALISPLEDEKINTETELAKCQMAFETWVFPAFSEIPIAGSTEWIQLNDFALCKTVIGSDETQKALYLFNEPRRLAAARGRLLPITFFISATPSEVDNTNVFQSVIDRIHFYNE